MPEEPYHSDDWTTIHCGDCRDVMREMPAESVDAIVTDPPYGLSFMGREWDHGVPGEAFWREALRVAKPGAYLVAFGGTRTFHRLTCAIEDAGWEVRDCLGWLYGSGFPKSLDVSKAIDKEAGAEREVVGMGAADCEYLRRGEPCRGHGDAGKSQSGATIHVPATAPATDAAKQWDGWGTALKPAWEPVILARKPLCGTVARNVQQYGTGALNIDGCRIATDDKYVINTFDDGAKPFGDAVGEAYSSRVETQGRWPANIVHDGSDEVLAVLGEQARFFYTAKASKAERDDGLFDFPEVRRTDGRDTEAENPRLRTQARRNFHPTVKPLDLMRWLVRLVTPPDGIVLDPFMGSGTTLKAARAEGHKSIGIDLEPEHCEIAWGRLSQGVLI